MKKLNLMISSVIIILTLLVSLVSALNIDFTIDVEDKIFFPNETIPANISITNREVTFIAKSVNLTLNIGKRSYEYKLGDIKAGQSTLKNLTLPEFPPGDYVLYGKLNYTGYFNEISTVETYNSFHVRFPEMERLPRNIIIKEFSIPDNVIAGKTYRISITVSNEGNVAGDLIIGIKSLDVDRYKEVHLEPGESNKVTLDVTFYNSGITNVEAVVYAVVNDVRYLLSFDTTNIFVKESKVAKLSLDKIELVEESDNEINQNDMVKIKISLFNNGNWLASNVKGTLKSSISEIEIIQQGNFGVIPKGGYSTSIFEIKTSNANIGSVKLILDVSYTDGLGNNSLSFEIPLNISEGSEACNYDSDCPEKQMCSNKRCIVVPCECGEVINHECHPYDCCNDLDCEEGYACDSESHKCEPMKEIKADVLIVASSRLRTNDDYNKALKNYRKTILEEGLTSFYIMLDSQKVQDLFNVRLANIDDWRSVKTVLDKILYKVEPDYLLILGGVDIIPQPPAKTTAEIPTIPVSDDRYSDIDLDGIPDIATGRIPSPSKDTIMPIIKTLKSSIEFRKKSALNKVIIADTCLFDPPRCPGKYDINLLSKSIFGAECEKSDNCYSAPPYCSDFKCAKKDEFYQYFLNSDIINLNAHGSPYRFSSHASDGNWYGVLTSNELYKKGFNGNPIFFTIACHGGAIDCERGYCVTKDGNVFSFLNNGAAVYIGNTRYGIGGGLTAGHLSEFYNNFEEGMSVAKAILKMKSEKLKKSYTDFGRAVIYEIQLYGDPTLKVNV